MNPEFNPENNFQNVFKISSISQPHPPTPPPAQQPQKSNYSPRLTVQNPLRSEDNFYKLNKISINSIPVSLEFMYLRNCFPHHTFYESLTFMCSCHHYALIHNSAFFLSHLKTLFHFHLYTTF